ncbi:hypothetical protein L6164_006873 [Bauhinia variegata]|nr:hypothetical protein L6164_006873 [Bauhinia variegata]
MGNQLNSTKLDQSVAPSLQVCQRYYNDIIVDLENASQDLKENPAAAKGFLDDAGYKVGFCNASKIPQILQINGIILRLVRNAAEHVKHSDDPEPIFNFNF